MHFRYTAAVLTAAGAMAKLPVIPVPSGAKAQPVDAGEVAARLAELAYGPPSGLVRDLAGPRVHDLADLVRDVVRAQHRRRRPIVPVRLPGAAARAFREGANLGVDADLGRRTWEDFLAERLRTPASAAGA